jgi:hypothetical protein
MTNTGTLSPEEKSELLSILKSRFEKNRNRHPDLSWETVLERFQKNEKALWSVQQMEESGGEPDVVQDPALPGEVVFCDCSAESPKGRRSICYDRAALDSRKEFKPASSAMDMATEMGIELLTEGQYRHLQTLGKFDTKTSSWISTPENIRKLGGAVFCDRRYETVFLYHNGAESYYAARAFRGRLTV